MNYKAKRVKTPTVIQMEAVECGAAALGIILGYYGKNIPLEELRYECGVSRDGSKASNIINAAKRKYGMVAKGFIWREGMDFERILQKGMPLILFWDMSHFIVLEGIKNNKFYINDPAYGPRKLSSEEFMDKFSKVYLKITPGDNFTTSKKKDNVYSSLSKRIGDNKRNILFALLISIALIVPGIVIPGMNKVFIDEYMMRGETNYFNSIIAIIALFSISSLVLNWILQTLLINLETKLLVNSSYEFMRHILKLPMRFFSQRSIGDVISRLQSNASIANMISHGVATNMFNMLQVVFYMTIMFLYNVQLTFIMIFFAIINILVYQTTKRMKRDAGFRVMEASSKMMGTTMVGTNTIESLKASGIEGDFFNRWSGYQAKFINTYQQQSILNMISTSIPFLCTQLSSALTLGVGALLIINGEITIGGLIGFIMLATLFNRPINGIVQFGNQIQEIAVDFKRLDDVLDYEADQKYDLQFETEKLREQGAENSEKKTKTGDRRPQTTDRRQESSEKAIEDVAHALQNDNGIDSTLKAAKDGSITRQMLNTYKLSGKVELKNITFGYSRLEEPLIQNFNLSLNPGDRVALVGTSGSGKSTIAKLITALYQPWDGEILFDGVSIDKIYPELLANSVSMVDQNPFFFKGTVRDNITMWDRNVEDSLLKKVSSDAEIYKEIASRNGAFEGDINEGGSNFSGGQLQRLEIARALINNPSILILDEATSALDPIVEKNIYSNLWANGASFIVIAHRLSAIRDCTEIIVLDHGKVIERGNHEQLVANKGYYYELVSNE
jgi:ATP-binding cassette, subfamily C, bacterial